MFTEKIAYVIVREAKNVEWKPYNSLDFETNKWSKEGEKKNFKYVITSLNGIAPGILKNTYQTFPFQIEQKALKFLNY